MTQDLARTPDQHDAVRNRTPDLKPSSTSGLPVTGLQSQSRTPAENYCRILRPNSDHFNIIKPCLYEDFIIVPGDEIKSVKIQIGLVDIEKNPLYCTRKIR